MKVVSDKFNGARSYTREYGEDIQQHLDNIHNILIAPDMRLRISEEQVDNALREAVEAATKLDRLKLHIRSMRAYLVENTCEHLTLTTLHGKITCETCGEGFTLESAIEQMKLELEEG